MITVEEATELVLSTARDYGSERVPLSQGIGRILAEEISADRDFPPFDRVMMDGIAINYDSYDAGQRRYQISAIGAAGHPQVSLHQSDHAVEIMTGAPLPHGADTVIRYEDTEIIDGYATITVDTITRGQSIHQQGRDHRQGEPLLTIGHIIKAIDINVLATVGKAEVTVKKHPSVAIISTGDELVDITSEPLPHQIRRSNAPMLAARLAELGIMADDYHIQDDEGDITLQLSQLLADYDVLLLSGGVSMGKYDLLPKALSDLGVKQLFHKVRQRPGKPLWFGQHDDAVVFAFPGNPVSTLACFHRYFIPWLYRCLGRSTMEWFVELTEDFTFRPDLHYLAQARVSIDQSCQMIAQISMGNGSGDIVHPTQMDGWVELPRGRDLYRAGETFRFIPFYPLSK